MLEKWLQGDPDFNFIEALKNFPSYGAQILFSARVAMVDFFINFPMCFRFKSAEYENRINGTVQNRFDVLITFSVEPINRVLSFHVLLSLAWIGALFTLSHQLKFICLQPSGGGAVWTINN
jgi:hypothetical protein